MLARVRRLATRPFRPDHRGRTVRLRLTLLYGGLFVASGALVLGITYGLVDRATKDDPVTFSLPGEGGIALSGSQSAGNPANSTPASTVDGSAAAPSLPTPADLAALGAKQHADRMHELLVQSGIALGVMTVGSIALGWVVAGRVLRPLRTITAAARDISATNLHARLALTGPDDELKELGDTFDDLLARLERSFEAQRRFVANASHELRTPLARQRTVAEVAIDDPEATVGSLRAAHERVLAAGAQQERLIDALLTLARGQTGSDRFEEFDLAALASRVAHDSHAGMKERGVELHVELAPAAAAGDQRLVERLITNLVDNAVRYNQRGGSVDISTGTRAGQAHLSVCNTGPVVPADALDRLFQPFERLDSERSSRGDGLGLGLSIVQAIAEAHRATLTAQAQSEGGLAVAVTFPVPNVMRQLCERNIEQEVGRGLRTRA
jgi:signal transduction histidine kinase